MAAIQVMPAIQEAASVADAERRARDETLIRPRPEWVVGVCPLCGSDVIHACYYISGTENGGSGYILVQECWERLGTAPTCTYRKVL